MLDNPTSFQRLEPRLQCNGPSLLKTVLLGNRKITRLVIRRSVNEKTLTWCLRARNAENWREISVDV